MSRKYKIESAGETLNLNFGRFRLRLAEIIEHARSDEAHDQRDDRDHDENFDQRKASLAVARLLRLLLKANALLTMARDPYSSDQLAYG